MKDPRQDSITKGQAFNLAVEIAVKEGKQLDNLFIVEQFVRLYDIAVKLHSNDVENIKAFIKSNKGK